MLIGDGKKSTDRWYPVYLVDATDGYTPSLGVATSAVTAYYATAGASGLTAYTVDTSAVWLEQGSGFYGLLVGADEFTTEDKYDLLIEADGCRSFAEVIQVRDRTVAEVIDYVDAILGLAGTSGVQIATGQTIGTVDIVQTANALANYAIPSLALATAAYTHMAYQVWEENIDTLHTAASSAGEALTIARQALAGKSIAEEGGNSMAVYARDASTVLVTLTTDRVAPTITRLPT